MEAYMDAEVFESDSYSRCCAGGTVQRIAATHISIVSRLHPGVARFAASSAKVMQQDDLYAARERTEVQTMVFKKDGKVYGSIESVVGEHCQNGGIAFLIVCYIAEVRKLRRIRE